MRWFEYEKIPRVIDRAIWVVGTNDATDRTGSTADGAGSGTRLTGRTESAFSGSEYPWIAEFSVTRSD